MAIYFNWFKDPNGYLKVIIFILSVVCIFLYYIFEEGGFKDVQFIYMARIILPANIFVLMYFLLGYIFDKTFDFSVRTELVFSITHGIFTLILGVESIYYAVVHRDDDESIPAGIIVFATFMLICGITLIIDSICTVRGFHI